MKRLTKFMMLLIAVTAMVCFNSCGKDDDPEKEDVKNEIYAGKDFVGTWQGTEGSAEFMIQLDADGTYTDWLFQDGERKFKEIGKYTVEGNILTAPDGCNLCNAWLNKPFTMTFSGKNQMTLTNSLMDDYKQKLVLHRK